MDAAFVLRQAVPHLPDGTVHLVVVDPGVGTERRALAARFRRGRARPRLRRAGQRDLGALGRRGPSTRSWLDRPEAWALGRAQRHLPRPRRVRAGRGPARGRRPPGRVGSPIGAPATMHWPLPRTDDEGVDGMVLHVDRFGNCVTNITRDDLERLRRRAAVQVLRGLDGDPDARAHLRPGHHRRHARAVRQRRASRDRRQRWPRRRPAVRRARRRRSTSSSAPSPARRARRSRDRHVGWRRRVDRAFPPSTAIQRGRSARRVGPRSPVGLRVRTRRCSCSPRARGPRGMVGPRTPTPATCWCG